MSYAELAERIGRPGASRAVGSANGRNPIAIVVPCHRVIAADGTLGGFGGGLDRKEWLLEHEGVAADRAPRNLERIASLRRVSGLINLTNTSWFCALWIAPACDFAVLAATNQGGDSAEKACDQAISKLINSLGYLTRQERKRR